MVDQIKSENRRTPLENRVNPWGDLIRTTARGTLMGNRGGVLHDSMQEIVRPFRSRQWITCVLEFKGRRRVPMTPGLYTELFFLDEATAFSAGHRPCAECRRERFDAFKSAWHRWSGIEGRLLVNNIDRTLHSARLPAPGIKAAVDSLPDGSFVEVEGKAFLVLAGSMLEWSAEGYRSRRPLVPVATVLTPEPFIHCFREGYQPQVHPSGLRLLRAR